MRLLGKKEEKDNFFDVFDEYAVKKEINCLVCTGGGWELALSFLFIAPFPFPTNSTLSPYIRADAPAAGQVCPYVWKEIEGCILGEFSPGQGEGGSKFMGKHPAGEKTE